MLDHDNSPYFQDLITDCSRDEGGAESAESVKGSNFKNEPLYKEHGIK